MNLNDANELERTREKLRLLEKQSAEARSRALAGSRAAELTVRSLSQLTNQLKEEIARFEAAAIR